MINIITGDIIGSREVEKVELWQKPLKEVLNKIGPSPKSWEIYRGDSFQVSTKPEEALFTALLIKATIKQEKSLDVRMAMGIGKNGSNVKRITEASGEAFIFSGETFDALKSNEQSLQLKTAWPEVDEAINMMLRLALIVMDHWSPNSAKLMKALLEHPNYSQVKLGALIGKSQSSVSEQMSRGHLQEILALEAYFRKRIRQQINEA